MNEINLMIEFLKHYRNNEYFLNQAITELKLAYTLCEYLNPDPNSKFEPYDFIKNGLLSPNRTDQMEAVDKILSIYECEFKSPEKIRMTLDYLVPKYFENTANAKDKRRRELLEELHALDKE